jgi:hypothetical protein
MLHTTAIACLVLYGHKSFFDHTKLNILLGCTISRELIALRDFMQNITTVIKVKSVPSKFTLTVMFIIKSIPFNKWNTNVNSRQRAASYHFFIIMKYRHIA